MRIAVLLLLFLFIADQAHTQSILTVRNPERDWAVQEGTIEEATITVQPLGIYSEVSLFLTFSAEGTAFAPEDSLEVTLDFTLPEEAAVIDSWLWIDDIIVKAAILDRRTARDIYEEIVNRRQDPSILYKTGPGQYQLRVYPMLGDGSRKVKVSYLMPNQWAAGLVRLDLPMEIVTSSRLPLTSVELRAWMKPEWGVPRLLEEPEMEFQWVEDPVLGHYYHTELSSGKISPLLTMGMDAPLEEGIYVNHNDSLKTYEAVLLPEELIELPPAPGRNVLAILDYKPYHTNNLRREHLLAGLWQELGKSLTPTSRFQLWGTTDDGGVADLTEGWIPGEAAALEAAFATLAPENIPSDGHLLNALSWALILAEEEEEELDILLISNSQSEGEPWLANDLVNGLREQAGFQLVNIHIIDYQNENVEEWWDWQGPSEWKGNELFYADLALLSGGSYRRAGQYRYKLRKTLEFTDKLRAPVELYTTVSGGICYNRHLLGGPAAQRPLRSPLYQVGRYYGDFPLQIEYSALIDDVPVFTSRAIGQETAYAADTLAEQAWAANYLLALENSNSGETALQEVVDKSIYYRVLSTQTAFLCLEPSQGGEACIACIDGSEEGGIIFGTEEVEAENRFLKIHAFPNPFARQVQLNIEFLPGAAVEDYQFYIFDMFGRIVNVLPAPALGSGHELSLLWDGRDKMGRELPAGMYLLVAEGPQGRTVVKLVKG